MESADEGMTEAEARKIISDFVTARGFGDYDGYSNVVAARGFLAGVAHERKRAENLVQALEIGPSCTCIGEGSMGYVDCRLHQIIRNYRASGAGEGR